jgi:(1->4)-alpha-D-glucan 1-alpha-D-glucosylmutase
VQPLIEPGRINSLTQVLLKLTAPGIPDLYQGSEIWDLSLVDPDNRRPVDYDLRRRLLAELPNLTVENVWHRIDEGLPKFWMIHHTLQTRLQHVASFGPEGVYRPLTAEGSRAAHVVAYLRGENIAVIAPRLPVKLNRAWINTTVQLPPGRWRNQFTGAKYEDAKLRLRDVLEHFPVALLVRAQQ